MLYSTRNGLLIFWIVDKWGLLDIPPQHYRLLAVLFVIFQNLMIRSYCKRHHYLSYRTWRNVAVGGNYSSVLSAMNLQAIIISSLARYVYWCKIGTNVMGVTSCLLIAFKACSMSKNPQLTQNLCSDTPWTKGEIHNYYSTNWTKQ